jgi:hypothetical protein
VSFPTIENAAILSMWLSMPLGGTWQAKVDSEAEALAGTVTISDGEGQAFVGRVVRSGVVTDRNRAFVVGGRGKIGDGGFTLSSKHFRAVNMRVIVNEILTQAGETLSPTSPAPLLATHFDFWTIPGGNGATPGVDRHRYFPRGTRAGPARARATCRSSVGLPGGRRVRTPPGCDTRRSQGFTGRSSLR